MLKEDFRKGMRVWVTTTYIDYINGRTETVAEVGDFGTVEEIDQDPVTCGPRVIFDRSGLGTEIFPADLKLVAQA